MGCGCSWTSRVHAALDLDSKSVSVNPKESLAAVERLQIADVKSRELVEAKEKLLTGGGEKNATARESTESSSWVEPTASGYELSIWKREIERLLNSKELIVYALSTLKFLDLDDLVDYFKNCKCARSEVELAWCVYLWLTDMITVKENEKIQSETGNHPEHQSADQMILGSNCQSLDGYSRLFEIIVTRLGLKCVTITGHCKPYWFKPNDSVESEKHSWSAVQLDGKWHLVDCAWSSGQLDKKGKKFKKSFQPYYFMTPPQVFIYDHFPSQESHQYLDKPITLRQFSEMAHLKLEYHLLGLKCISHRNVCRLSSNTSELFIEYEAPENVKIKAVLFENVTSSDKSLKRFVFVQRDLKAARATILAHIDRVGHEYRFKLIAGREKCICEINYIIKQNSDLVASAENLKMPEYDSMHFGRYDLRCESLKSVIMNATLPRFDLKFECKSDLKFEAELRKVDDDLCENRILMQRSYSNPDLVELRVNLPEKKSVYFLEIGLGPRGSVRESYARYLIKVDESMDESLFDSSFEFIDVLYKGAYVQSPQEYKLRVNELYHFKIYISDAKKVWLECVHEDRIEKKYLYKVTDSPPHIWIIYESFVYKFNVKLKAKIKSDTDVKSSTYELCSYELV